MFRAYIALYQTASTLTIMTCPPVLMFDWGKERFLFVDVCNKPVRRPSCGGLRYNPRQTSPTV